MSIQIISDLHLEAPKAYDVYDIIPHAPVLALLGDIGNISTHKDDYLAFLTRQLEQFRTVLLVPGNHEAYHSDWPTALSIFRKFEQDARTSEGLGDFVLLDRAAFLLPSTSTVVLGCSLFSHVPSDREMQVSMRLNDFFHTGGWDVTKHNAAHERDLAWLNAQVAAYDGSDVSIVILSHWSPSLDARATDPKHAGSAITCAFSTDLSEEACFKSRSVKLWAFGHTHFNCDFSLARKGGAGPIRLLANQRGYYFAQAEGYDVKKIIDVSDGVL